MRSTTATAAFALLLLLPHVGCISSEASPWRERAASARWRILRALRRYMRLERGVVFDIANLTAPSVPHRDCGPQTCPACKGGGAYYMWCDRLVERVLDLDPERGNLMGLSYGVSSWDSWSKYWGDRHRIPTHLYDCFATAPLAQYARPYTRHQVCLGGSARVDRDGRSWATLGAHLAGRPPLSTLVKMDVEGSEWQALPDFLRSAPNMRAVALLDVEFHFCVPGAPGVEEMVGVFRALTESFAATGRFPVDSPEDAAESWPRQFDKGGRCNGLPTYVAVSYVNRQLLPGATPLDPS